ncbi:MAG: CRTAC1 family protein, partial [Pirellula sp.]|nr:CRTAC1 family protein [Pirellula sp.]
DCSAWSTSAAWIDVDLDGNLDLYVCNYVKYDPQHAKSCVDNQGNAIICNPLTFEPEPDVFYWNDGSGSFQDVTMERGLHGPNNRALGVVSADFDQDGWPDLYVANDASNNFLFRNLKNGYFEEVAVESGCATDRRGVPQASMGLAVNDYNRDGRLDIYSTHFQSESNTLYRNLGSSGFIDVTGSEGLHTPTLDKLGFGTVMQDLDQDGYMEIFVANGHIDNSGVNPNEKMEGQLFTYHNRKWHDISLASGDWFQSKLVSRGATFTDFDLDGRIDLGVTNQSSPMSLLRNESEPGKVCWLKLIGVTSNRNGLGAKITTESDDGLSVYEVTGGGSYCSASWYLVPVNANSHEKPGKIKISWPSGTQQELEIPHYGVLAISTEK